MKRTTKAEVRQEMIEKTYSYEQYRDKKILDADLFVQINYKLDELCRVKNDLEKMKEERTIDKLTIKILNKLLIKATREISAHDWFNSEFC